MQEYYNGYVKGTKCVYLTLAGSISYGTNNETSDVDIRGCYIPDPTSYWKIQDSFKEEIEDTTNDVVVYTLKKYLQLLMACNPNVIETLGTKPEHVLYINDVGLTLRNNSKWFLSKRAYITFAQYANAQLRRLENALARDNATEIEKERHIMDSIKAMLLTTTQQYGITNNDVTFDLQDEIMITANIHHLPLRKFLQINSDMKNIVSCYNKLNHRNRKKDFNHLCKHAMHLIRLYFMGIDILKHQQIITYRSDEQQLLMSIRNGDMPFKEVFALQKELQRKLDKVYEESKLPDVPDVDKINDFLIRVYRETIV